MFSKYTLILNQEEKVRVFNTLNGNLIEISKEIYENIQDGKISEEIKEYLKNKEFINIETDLVRKKIIRAKKGALTLNLTNMCNFNCEYCYYKASNKSKVKKVINGECFIHWLKEKYLKEFNDIQSLSINFIGGEPTLEKELIIKIAREVNDICLEKDINIDYSLTTNGYFLSKQYAKELAGVGIYLIQVTLDGYKDIHDKLRKDKKIGKSYDKIIQNLSECKDILDICVRINFNADTDYHSIKKLLINLRDIKVQNIYFAAIEDTVQACNIVSLKNSELVDKYEFFWKLQKELDFKFIEKLPPLLGICPAKNSLAFNIDSDGNVYSCQGLCGQKDKAILNIYEMSNKNIVKRDIDISEDCKECKYYPICLGGCEYQNSIQRNNCNKKIYDKLIPKYLKYKYH